VSCRDCCPLSCPLLSLCFWLPRKARGRSPQAPTPRVGCVEPGQCSSRHDSMDFVVCCQTPPSLWLDCYMQIPGCSRKIRLAKHTPSDLFRGSSQPLMCRTCPLTRSVRSKRNSSSLTSSQCWPAHHYLDRIFRRICRTKLLW
jgi:hypothetical protein